MLTRRSFIRSGVTLAVISGAADSNVAYALPSATYGCCLPDSEFDPLMDSSSGVSAYEMGSEPIIHHSGDDAFDRALAQMLASISGIFNVLPGFGFYDDGGPKTHNAYANHSRRLNRTDGTVLFGLGLLGDKKEERPNGSRVAAVCAHEYGHVVQFNTPGLRKRLLDNQPTVKAIELHADFLAGYFAARHKEEKPNFPAAEFAVSQYEGGDIYVNSQGHHGTKKERGDAVATGFKSRSIGKLSFSQAIDQGVSYVLSV